MPLLQRFKEWRKERKIAALQIKATKLRNADAQERREIAQRFNERYVSATPYDKESTGKLPGETGAWGRPVSDGYRWMCPNCNKIHAGLRNSLWVGIIYPKCCTFPEGERFTTLGPRGDLLRPLGFCGPKGLYVKALQLGVELRE